MNIVWLIFAFISFVTFIVYGIDKFKARRGLWRISEKTLLALSLLGGAAGGLLAMQIYRHKTRHWYFYVINVGALLLQLALLIYLTFRFGF